MWCPTAKRNRTDSTAIDLPPRLDLDLGGLFHSTHVMGRRPAGLLVPKRVAATACPLDMPRCLPPIELKQTHHCGQRRAAQ